MTADEALAYANTDQYSDDPVVGALAAEVERLRDVLNTQDVQHAHERAVHAKANAQAREEVERLRAENAGLRSRLTVLDAWASDLADSITSLRMRNIFPATEPGAGA